MRSTILFLLMTGTLQANQYSTSFPQAENPISEGGNWLNGGSNGLSWTNVRTATGMAYGTMDGNLSGNAQYSDSTALLTGSWGPVQTVTGIALVTQTPTGGNAELELRVHSAISAQVCTGYELDVSTVPRNTYFALDRWNGALGSFTQLAVNSGVPAVRTGDSITFSIDQNGNMVGYLNGQPMVTATDNMFPSGSPGMGFFASGSQDDSTYGWSSFTAADAVLSPPPGPTPTQSPSSTPLPSPPPQYHHHHHHFYP